MVTLGASLCSGGLVVPRVAGPGPQQDAVLCTKWGAHRERPRKAPGGAPGPGPALPRMSGGALSLSSGHCCRDWGPPNPAIPAGPCSSCGLVPLPLFEKGLV